jgi:hypothetical protein
MHLPTTGRWTRVNPSADLTLDNRLTIQLLEGPSEVTSEVERLLIDRRVCGFSRRPAEFYRQTLDVPRSFRAARGVQGMQAIRLDMLRRFPLADCERRSAGPACTPSSGRTGPF